MKRVGELYEVVVFTASVSKVVDGHSVLAKFMPDALIVWRSFTRPARHTSRCSPSSLSRKLLQPSRELRKGMSL